jgi:hypothetical protein
MQETEENNKKKKRENWWLFLYMTQSEKRDNDRENEREVMWEKQNVAKWCVMEAVSSSQKLIHIYQTTWCNINII